VSAQPPRWTIEQFSDEAGIARGKFTFVFALQCLSALGCHHINIGEV
jgi:hypothetical protein